VSNLEQVQPLSDNRSNADRRVFSWRTILFGFLRSRRRMFRRSAEVATVFTDWHHPWLFFLATGIMLLSSLDAFFTLQLLARGAIEVNPFMATALGYGDLAFAASKMLLTGVGILLLVYMARTRFLNVFRTGILLTLFFATYACLVCYQFLLLLH
jgi:Domain of unknown function (DUF5658)